MAGHRKTAKTAGRFILQTMGKAKLTVVLLSLVTALGSVINLWRALVMRNIINTAIAGDKHGFIMAVLCLVGIIVTNIILAAFDKFMSVFTATGIENKLKTRLTNTLLHRAYDDVTRIHSGEWINRLTSDTGVVSQNATSLLPSLTGMLVQLFGATAMLIAYQPRLLLLAMPVGLLVSVCSWALRRIMKRMHKEVQESDGVLRGRVLEILNSLMVVRAFSAEDAMHDYACNAMKTNRRLRLKRVGFATFISTGFAVVINSLYLATLIFCGYALLTKSFTYGDFTAVLTLVGQVEAPFGGLSGIIPSFYAMLASAERLMEAEQMKPDDAEPLDDARIRTLYEGLDSIALKNLSFGYRSIADGEIEKNVLDHLDLTICKGDAVAFTGQSGCGKSTILKLFMSLYEPTEGERLLTCRGNSEPLTAEHRRLFAYVPQGNHLMSGTIREVVSFAHPERVHDDEALKRALTIACADGFIAKLPDGLDAKLGEHGCGLSEGEMQRIAIARALFTDRPILMLDEATSALDEDTERSLLTNLHCMTDKTVLTVTHRRSVLAICDKVVDFSESGIRITKT